MHLMLAPPLLCAEAVWFGPSRRVSLLRFTPLLWLTVMASPPLALITLAMMSAWEFRWTAMPLSLLLVMVLPTIQAPEDRSMLMPDPPLLRIVFGASAGTLGIKTP